MPNCTNVIYLYIILKLLCREIICNFLNNFLNLPGRQRFRAVLFSRERPTCKLTLSSITTSLYQNLANLLSTTYNISHCQSTSDAFYAVEGQFTLVYHSAYDLKISFPIAKKCAALPETHAQPQLHFEAYLSEIRSVLY